MSISFDRCGGSSRTGTRDRQAVHVEDHVGSRQDFHARLARAAQQAAIGQKVDEFRNKLKLWATDERLLWLAYQQLRQQGGQAPGVDGMTYDDLPDRLVWAQLRALRDACRDGSYHAAPLREVMIPKLSGNGIRTLQVPTIWDRVLGKAIVMALSPFFETRFDERSFGFRPQRGRQSAIAHAVKLAELESRYVWGVADIKDAFPSIPRSRLLELIETHVGPGPTGIISQLADNGQRRGIPQGQPLCPLLLNSYADRFVDQMIRRLLPNVRLIRYADDLLLLCRTREDTAQALDTIRQQLQPHGWRLKDDVQTKDLEHGEYVDFMGARVDQVQGKWRYRLGEPSWNKLKLNLELAQRGPKAPIAAYEGILGWLRQQGFLVEEGTEQEVLDRVSGTARTAGFRELPTPEMALEAIYKGRQQFHHLLAAEEGIVRSARCGGSATPALREIDRAGRAESCRSAPPAGCFTLFTDGSCLSAGDGHGPGGWAYWVWWDHKGQGRWTEGAYGGIPDTTNNRMELAGALRGLGQLPDGANVTVVSDSRYVSDNARNHLTRWNDLGHLNPRSGVQPVIANADLWLALIDQMARLNCTFEWVRGHSGNLGNQACDRLAAQAAHLAATQGSFERRI